MRTRDRPDDGCGDAFADGERGEPKLEIAEAADLNVGVLPEPALRIQDQPGSMRAGVDETLRHVQGADPTRTAIRNVEGSRVAKGETCMRDVGGRRVERATGDAREEHGADVVGLDFGVRSARAQASSIRSTGRSQVRARSGPRFSWSREIEGWRLRCARALRSPGTMRSSDGGDLEGFRHWLCARSGSRALCPGP